MNKVQCLKRIISRISGKRTEQIDGDTVCKLLDELCDCVGSEEDYKQEETDTGKKWIDGKPIYRLTVDATLGTLAAAINEREPDTVVSFFGRAYCHTTKKYVCIPSTTMGASAYNLDFLQDDTDGTVAINFGGYFQAEHRAYCTIEYTKKSEG
jgi:hypothetical protein